MRNHLRIDLTIRVFVSCSYFFCVVYFFSCQFMFWCFIKIDQFFHAILRYSCLRVVFIFLSVSCFCRVLVIFLCRVKFVFMSCRCVVSRIAKSSSIQRCHEKVNDILRLTQAFLYATHRIWKWRSDIQSVISLPLTPGNKPKAITTMVNFTMVKVPLAYNDLPSRPSKNALRISGSSPHSKVKFPTLCGIGVSNGDQQVTK